MGGVLKKLFKIIVVPLSITLSIIGIGLIVLGFLGPSLAKNYLPQLLSSLPSDLQTLIENGIGPFCDFAKYFGAVLTALGIFGVVVSCLGISTLLRLYGVTAFIIAGIFAIGFYQFTSGSVETKLKNSTKDTIREKYYGCDDKSTTTLAWTMATFLLRCCGVDNYADFNETQYWNRNCTMQNNVTIYQKSPISCCVNNATKNLPTLPDISTIAGLTSLPAVIQNFISLIAGNSFMTDFAKDFDPKCSEQPNADNSNYMTGCWSKVISMFEKYFNIIKIVLYVILAILILIGLLAIGASFHMDPDKKNEVSKNK